MRDMAAGRQPLPRDERLLRFGLHALPVARDTSIFPDFLALLRCSPLDLNWLFPDCTRIDQACRLTATRTALAVGPEHEPPAVFFAEDPRQ